MKYNYKVEFENVETSNTKYTSKFRFYSGNPKFYTKEEADCYIDNQNNETDKTTGKSYEEIYSEHGQRLVAVKIERKKRESKVHDPNFNNPYKVGDILCGDCGCTMTIPVWYEVIKVTPTRVRVKQLLSHVTSGSYMQGESMPLLGFYEREGNYKSSGAVEKLFSEDSYCVRIGRTITTLWNGKPMWHDHLD